MNESTISELPKANESALASAAKKFGVIFCGTCIVGWIALGLVVIGVTLARVLG